MKNLFTLALFAFLATAGCVVSASFVAPIFELPIAPVALGIGAMAVIASFGMPKLAIFEVIPGIQSMKLFTQKLVAVYREQTPVKGFLRSFFKSEFSMTKFVSIAVRRNTELVASDVLRYSDGNRNKFTKASLKTFLPPYFHEFLDASDHHLYDAMITAISNNDLTFFAQMTREMANDFVELRKKIERAVELQCAQIFQTGVITLKSGDNIDFKRKAASIVGYSAPNNFADDTVDPSAVILEGCNFLRETGKANGAIFNLILGESVIGALLNNAIIKSRNDIKNMNLDQIYSPEMMPEGMALHGELSCGSYKVRLWTYPETYETSPGVSVNYIDSKQIILLPLKPDFTLAYAAVPQLIKDGRIPQTGEYLIQEEFKDVEGIHRLHIKSASLPIPTAVDQIWNAQVLA